MRKLFFIFILFLFTVLAYPARFTVIVKKATGGPSRALVVNASNGFNAGKAAMDIANRRWGGHHIVLRIQGGGTAAAPRTAHAGHRRAGIPCWNVTLVNRINGARETFWVVGWSTHEAVHNARKKAKRLNWKNTRLDQMTAAKAVKVRCPRTEAGRRRLLR